MTGADFIPYADFPAKISEQEKKRACFQAAYDTAMALTDSFDVLIFEMLITG